MSETFSVVITTLGLAEIAAAVAGATQVSLDNFSVGDSNGSYYEPSEGQTSLVNQQYLAAITTLEVDSSNANWLVVTGTVPADSVGGWYVREGGVWSSTGNLFAVAKIPATFKPLLSAGAGKDLVIEMVFETTNVSSITLISDPTIAIATKSYVDSFGNYVKTKFNDCVVCPGVTNPAGDSGAATNPYGVSLSTLRPNTNSERIFVYFSKQKADGRTLSNDPRVFIQGDVGNSNNSRNTSTIADRIGLNAPSSVQNKIALNLNTDAILFCSYRGTGLNLIWSPAILITTDIEHSVDGGAWTTLSYSNAVMTSLAKSDTLGVKDSIVSGQTYGEHTVRFRIKSTSNYSYAPIIGFDIISDYDSVRVSPGDHFIDGGYLSNSAGGDLTPTAISTNNHRRDLVVIGKDNVIELIAGTAVDTPKYYLDSGFDTERAKEELKNSYLSSDFYQGNGYAKTLGDGVTNLQADQLITIDSTIGIDVDDNNVPWVNPYAKGFDTNYKFTFVGTGCDVQLRLEDIGGSVTGVALKIYVDEVLKGTLTEANFANVEAAGGDSYLNYSICTGLPYGTHTVRLVAVQTGIDSEWRGITYGNGVWVTVNDHATNTRAMTSEDGITWIARVTAADNNWQDIVFAEGQFVACARTGTNNRIMTSPNGVDWTIRTTPVDNWWATITHGGGTFICTSWDGTGDRCISSPDGITWTSRTTPVDNKWVGSAYGNSIFVAVSIDGTGDRAMSSPDGITWTSRTSAADNAWNGVVFGASLFVAVSANGSGNRVMTSPDGITWTSRTSAADNGWQDVAWNGTNLFVAVADSGTGNRIMTSADGITWVSRTSPADYDWKAVWYANSLWVAVGTTGLNSQRIMTSTDGISWTLRATVAGASGNWSMYLKGFSTYQAKTPVLTADHLELGCVGMTPSDGWVNYSPSQAKYLGSQWNRVTSVSLNEDINYRSFGYDVSCLTGDTTSDTAEFVFNGTSVIWLGASGSNKAKVKITLDGIVLTTSHPDWATITVTTAMPSSWVNTTGIVDCYEAGHTLEAEREGIKITGLSAGLHTLKLEGSGKNASSSDYDIPVHGFKIIPLLHVVDDSQNWAGDLNNISRNCSAVKSDPKISELERDKQNKSNVLDTAISESIIESGYWEDSLADASTPFTVAPTRKFTVSFRTTKAKTPILILVNTGGNDGVASAITKTEFKVDNAADTSIEFPDMIVQWTAIAQ